MVRFYQLRRPTSPPDLAFFQKRIIRDDELVIEIESELNAFLGELEKELEIIKQYASEAA